MEEAHDFGLVSFQLLLNLIHIQTNGWSQKVWINLIFKAREGKTAILSDLTNGTRFYLSIQLDSYWSHLGNKILCVFKGTEGMIFITEL